jgi:hypothetical protein
MMSKIIEDKELEAAFTRARGQYLKYHREKAAEAGVHETPDPTKVIAMRPREQVPFRRPPLSKYLTAS